MIHGLEVVQAMYMGFNTLDDSRCLDIPLSPWPKGINFISNYQNITPA